MCRRSLTADRLCALLIDGRAVVRNTSVPAPVPLRCFDGDGFDPLNSDIDWLARVREGNVVPQRWKQSVLEGLAFYLECVQSLDGYQDRPLHVPASVQPNSRNL